METLMLTDALQLLSESTVTLELMLINIELDIDCCLFVGSTFSIFLDLFYT